MADRTAIQRADASWNPVTGCNRVSPGCAHCYALDLAARLKRMQPNRYQRDGDPKTSGPGFGLQMYPETLDQPLRWQRPRRIFVNSMSDLFHEGVPLEYIVQVFGVMTVAERHTFQVLTKRPERMKRLLRDRTSGGFWDQVVLAALDWEKRSGIGSFRFQHGQPNDNIWLGTSVENQHWADVRVPLLLETPAAVRFLSCEPLLGPVALYTDLGEGEYSWPAIDWVIVGGESGAKHRAMDPAWARSLRDQCAAAGIPFFFKQHGGHHPKANGRELDGREWSEFPA